MGKLLFDCWSFSLHGNHVYFYLVCAWWYDRKECLEELVDKIKRNRSLVQLFLDLILQSDYINIFTNPNGCSVIKHCLTNFDYPMSRVITFIVFFGYRKLWNSYHLELNILIDFQNLYTILEKEYSKLAPRSGAYMLIIVGMAKSRNPHRESLLNLAAVNSLYLSMHQFG